VFDALQAVSYLRPDQPGQDIATFPQDAGVVFEVSDEWVDSDSVDTNGLLSFQAYTCILEYNQTEVPTDPGDRITFQNLHWSPKGDSIARDNAIAANALADGKTFTFRQQTVPNEAEQFDIWFKNFDAPDDDKDELFVNKTGTYTNASIDADFPTSGFATKEEFRESFWQIITDPEALAAANAAAVDADSKGTNFFSNDPPDKAETGDTWTDKDASPKISYINKVTYDFEGESFSWITEGSNDPPPGGSSPLISFYWDATTDTTFADIANRAEAVADGKTAGYTGDSPPENSGVIDPNTGILELIDIGDLWIKVDDTLTDDNDISFTAFVCWRQYRNISGVDFPTFTGPSVDGASVLIPPSADFPINVPGDPGFVPSAGFEVTNAFNYWKATRSPEVLQFATDITAIESDKLARDGSQNMTGNLIVFPQTGDASILVKAFANDASAAFSLQPGVTGVGETAFRHLNSAGALVAEIRREAGNLYHSLITTDGSIAADMKGKKIVGGAPGVAATDYVIVSQVPTNSLGGAQIPSVRDLRLNFDGEPNLQMRFVVVRGTQIITVGVPAPPVFYEIYHVTRVGENFAIFNKNTFQWWINGFATPTITSVTFYNTTEVWSLLDGTAAPQTAVFTELDTFQYISP